jgi:prevent-host-death family protein
MKIEIGAYEAKTRLPELLRQVKAGKRFTITNRGLAVADLVPSESPQASNPRAAIGKFRAFMRANPIKRRANIRALIREGRE